MEAPDMDLDLSLDQENRGAPSTSPGGCGCGGASPLPAGILGDLTSPPVVLDADCSCAEAEEILELPAADVGIEDFDSPVEAPDGFFPESSDAQSWDEPSALAPVAPTPDTYVELLSQVKAALVPQLLRMWEPPPGPVTVVSTGGTNTNDFYGDGADGDLSVTGTVTMNRDMFFGNLSIGASGRLKTEGYRVFVRGKLTIASGGRISANGADGAAGSGATGGAGGAGGGGGTSFRPFLARGAAGGDGGTSGGSGTAFGADASGGVGTALSQACAPYLLISGSGGGGGGYAGSASGATDAAAGKSAFGADGGKGGTIYPPSGSVNLGGGGGGGGGGVVLVFASQIVNDGRIEAKGGDGGVGASGGGGEAGGGGGGAGGVVFVYYTTLSGSGDLYAGGGSGHGDVSTLGATGYTDSYQVQV